MLEPYTKKGKLHQLTAEMNNYKLDILAVSEVRWNEFRELKTSSGMQMAKEKPIIQQMKERKWQWMGHTLRKDPQVIER
jgi:hypothetical protein